MIMTTYQTCEAVLAGHPDKLCDYIADAILDACLALDKSSRVACEVMATKGHIIVAGEITCNQRIDVKFIVRRALSLHGYSPWKYRISVHLHQQSTDIQAGVDKAIEARGTDSAQPQPSDLYDQTGAGDQGTVYGYATSENREMLPMPLVLAHRICRRLDVCRRKGTIAGLGADGKAQVTVAYRDGKPVRVKTVVISVQHDKKMTREELERDVRMCVLPYAFHAFPLDKGTEILVNPSGRFVIGGPDADTGLTGRKLMVDTYGGVASQGGGAHCVDCDTEFLTPYGWKKMSEYVDGDQVAQWNYGQLEFVTPQAFVTCKAERMYQLKSAIALDMVLSENHDMVIITSKGNPIKKPFKQMFPDGVLKTGNHGFVPIYFNFSKQNTSVSLSDDEIRLQIAFCADGTLRKNNLGRIRIKKARKIERLRGLLKATGTDYREGDDHEYKLFYFRPPIANKLLSQCFFDCNSNQMKVIAEEVQQWDGDEKLHVFRTTQKVDADFVQFVFMATYGTNASILVDDRIGETFSGGYHRKSILYEVCSKRCKTTQIKESLFTDNTMSVERFVPSDGLMYCFCVPVGMLVLRRNNRVFVTGNSGKDPTKVDRSGAYMARYIAKNLVYAGLAERAEVGISYAIGKARPVMVSVKGFGTSALDDETLTRIVTDVFDMRPRAMIDHLGLRDVTYRNTSSYGHFGNQLFPWERTDQLEALRDAMRRVIEGDKTTDDTATHLTPTDSPTPTDDTGGKRREYSKTETEGLESRTVQSA